MTPLVQWLYTALFVGVAIYFVGRAMTARARPIELIEHLLHIAMAIVMAAMAWPWWSSWPWALQLVFFLGATAWFLLMLLLQITGSIPQGRHGRFAVWYQAIHTVMMASMVWMVAVMPPPSHAGGVSGHDHGAGAGADVAAMSSFAFWSGVVLTVMLFIAALVEAVALMRRTTEDPVEHHPHGEAGAVVLMLLGMASMCALMLQA